MTTAESFEEFMQRREAASNEYIRGNPQQVSDMLTNSNPATFMPPSGAVIVGAGAVKQSQVEGAAGFGPKSTGYFEVSNSGSSGDLGYWTGQQIATVNLAGKGETVDMTLRTTEIFRRENGKWKMVHRHADIPHSNH